MIKTHESSTVFWKHKRVVVTGGTGFVGNHVVSMLRMRRAKEIVIPDHATFDLREYSSCLSLVRKADIVIHLAGNVGGIGYNEANPATLFDDNVLMGVYMLRASHEAKVKKFIGIGTVCAYPKFTPVPFREEDLWSGYPEETNAAYGLAKKMLLVQSQAYRKQYGMNCIYLLPANIYGPGDSFDPSSSHVIPALIREMDEAKRKKKTAVHVWGTGRATREFLYVEDAARAIVLASEQYNGEEPVNIGSGNEVSIRELADAIASVVGFTGEIHFNPKKPDGQPRRRLDTEKANALFGFVAMMPFQKGLKETVRWYRAHRASL